MALLFKVNNNIGTYSDENVIVLIFCHGTNLYILYILKEYGENIVVSQFTMKIYNKAKEKYI